MKKLFGLVAILLIALTACQAPEPVMEKESVMEEVVEEPVMEAEEPVMEAEEPVMEAEAPVMEETSEAMEEPVMEKSEGSVVEVSMANLAYSPATVTIKVGDSVRWTNVEATPHTVTSTLVNYKYDSGTLRQGQSFTQKYTLPGTYSYKCAFHGAMRGTVVVEE